jgi:hypothetical protein
MPGPPDKYLGLQSKDYANVAGLAQAFSDAHAEGFTTIFSTCPDPRDSTNTWFTLSGYPKGTV